MGLAPSSWRAKKRRPDSAPTAVRTCQEPRVLGQTAAAPRIELEEVRLRDDRLLQEQMVTIYTHLGMLSRGKFSLSPRGRGQGEGVPLLRLDAETHLATFSHKGEKEHGTVMRGLHPRISLIRHPDESRDPALGICKVKLDQRLSPE